MSSPVTLDPQSQPLAGQVVVFTGNLSSFTQRAARALVRQLGGEAGEAVDDRTTWVVLGGTPEHAPSDSSTDDRASGTAEVGAGGGTDAVARRVLERRSAGVRILSEAEFCTLAGVPSSDPLARQRYRVRDILGMYPTLREERLRHLANWGLIGPAVRTPTETSYSFKDVGVIKQVSTELAGGRSFRSVVRSMLAAREGQLSLDFQPAPPRSEMAKVITMERAATRRVLPDVADQLQPDGSARRRAAEYFLEGFALDEGDAHHHDEALFAYRRALTLDPDLVPALVNLGNIHYAREQRVEAQALYERAIRLQTDCFEAHFNLGHVHHDLGRYAEARDSYRLALGADPAYAEGHFYLAVVLEKMGRSDDARHHWRAYRRLAPHGEWVELAREFSE